MDSIQDLKSIDTIILCGGVGSRLKPIIPKTPKILVKFGDKTFFDILLTFLKLHNIKRVILCVGVMKEQIKNYCKKYYGDFDFIFSEENKPLGTGGALKKANSLIKGNSFFILNGDSICKINLMDFFNFHIIKKSTCSIVLTFSNNAKDYGNIAIDSRQKIISFKEKSYQKGISLINAGIYLMNQDFIKYFPREESFSIENDVFPNLPNINCFGFLAESDVVDIGTPERYNNALKIL